MSSSLFRPWIEDNIEKCEVKKYNDTNFCSNSIEATQESVWIEKKDTDDITIDETSDRETKYRNVKEHIKKRNEKYLQKKLKNCEGKYLKNSNDSFSNWEISKFSEVNFVPQSTGFYPNVEGFSSSLDFNTYKNNNLYGAPFYQYPHGTEFIESALINDFPPNLFEEYAKFLTEQQKQAAERTRKQRPKKFRCPHCQVGFSNNGQLKGHIRIHTGERPFKCDVESCGKSFTRNEELTRHRRIHSGLRPFPCSECGKRFGRKDHLKKHIKTHFQQKYQLVPILPSPCPYLYGL